jgi:8-oxo-dGTP pyrophosphatase MutT (NUDIX family)
VDAAIAPLQKATFGWEKMKGRNIASAYITHGQRLLVFRAPEIHDAPVMVPGGLVEEDETPEEAVLREAREETGLTNLRRGAFLGSYRMDAPDSGEAQFCWCYHLVCEGDVPEKWVSYERDPAIGPKRPIRLELWWVPLPDGVPPLGFGCGQVLPALMEALSARPEPPAGADGEDAAAGP